MILCLNEWEFDIDIQRTMEYSAAEAAEHCSCAYCRNFYSAIDTHYPSLRPFLSQFGLDIEAPEEQMPYDHQGHMIYDSTYLVYGKTIKMGQGSIVVDNIEVSFASALTDRAEDCFTLSFDATIPWVLSEPMEETVSPANEPFFLKKMWDTLLMRFQKSDFES